MTSSLIAALRKGLSPAHKHLLDEIANDPVVNSILEKADASTVADRATKVAELAAIPARHAKSIKAAGVIYAAAVAEVNQAVEALNAARGRCAFAGQVSSAADRQPEVEMERLRRELRAGASNLLHAAFRAVNAMSVSRFLPEEVWSFVPRFSEWDTNPHREAVEAANKVVAARFKVILDAENAQRQTLATLESLMLQAIGEVEVAERVTSLFRSLNVMFAGLKGSPHMVITEFGDVELRCGPGEAVLTVKPSSIGAEKLQ